MRNLVLESTRMVLREITMDDLDDLLQIWGDPEAMRYFPHILDRPAMQEWINLNLKRYDQYGHGIWAVISKTDRSFLGDCGLVMQDVEGTIEMEVGYHFNPAHWGSGYATEAARACMQYAKEILGRNRIISMIRPENMGSRGVAERNGLRIEKEIFWRGYNHYVYAANLRAAHAGGEGLQEQCPINKLSL
jgi:RimJ/RimL family protein N-acetyltransferase